MPYCVYVGKVKNRENHADQGCQMVYFQTQNPNLDKFWRVLQWKMLVYFMALLSILRPFGIFLYGHLVFFMAIWYIFPSFGILYKDKSGNPDADTSLRCRRDTPS
jgi:hypothetical protein